MIDIDKYLNNEEDKKMLVCSKKQEDEITRKAIFHAIDNMCKVIVLNSGIKDFIVDSLRSEFKELGINKDDLESSIITLHQAKNWSQDGYNGFILLYLSIDTAKEVIESYIGHSLYIKGFVSDPVLLADPNDYIEEKALGTEQFKEAIRLSMQDKNKDENLLEVTIKNMIDEPKVYYKGKKLDIDNFTGLEYAFRYEDDHVDGQHILNVELDDEHGTSVIGHKA